MGERYLVTGGAGFIGSNLVRHLLTTVPDASVINVDALTYAGVEPTVRELDGFPGHRFVRGDIRDAELMSSLMEGVNVVFNLAAESHVDRSIAGPAIFADTNVVGTATLLEAARRADVGRFVQVSTDEVYGSVSGYPDESAPLEPTSPYSASKAAADLYALSYHRTYGYPVVISRCTNNFGPYQFPEKVIPLFVTNLLRDEKVPLYGTGRNERDWLFVEDHCRALLILATDGSPGEIYNIGADSQLSNLELTRRILDIMDRDDSFIEYVADRLGHDLRYAVDSSKMRALGWKPLESLDTQLEQTITWYVDREDWWEPLRSRSQ